ncbi:MAG TPA: 3-dehydroquinate synthase [Actinomycetota bacterium]|nr:3-dehydroquinate synthase [Actinomycetota bacterium]
MIVLIGFMGAGKSAVGRLVADRLNLPFIDTDAEIEADTGTTIREMFRDQGEAAFRALEAKIASAALASGSGVVSLGGGAPASTEVAEALQGHDVVFLEVSLPVALERVGGRTDRPMLSGNVPRLFNERLAIYRGVAGATIDADDDPETVAARVIHACTRPHLGRGPASVDIDVPGSPHRAWVGEGISAALPDFLPALPDAEKVVVVTHPELEVRSRPMVNALETRGLRVTTVAVPSGEGSKSLETVASVYADLTAAGIHRGDLLVGFGGGVITDLTGFVASTYNRGVKVVHVPSTLLAQVDAAIGGKTAINLPEGKNLVGSWHQPSAIVCDVSLLATLPARQMRSGLAEVIKYGFIWDPDLLRTVLDDAESLLAGDPEPLASVVVRCIRIKAAVVGADEKETGLRAILNYGHTFGHAIEHLGRGAVTHGEAIALGMMAAAHLACELGRVTEDVVDLHRSALSVAGLPVAGRFDASALESIWARDKKYQSGVRFVLLSDIGKPEVGVKVDPVDVRNAIERLAHG